MENYNNWTYDPIKKAGLKFRYWYIDEATSDTCLYEIRSWLEKNSDKRIINASQSPLGMTGRVLYTIVYK